MVDQPTQTNDSDWNAVQARVTAFHPNGGQVPSIETWAREEYGRELERIQSNPRDGSVQILKWLSNGQLTVNSALGRTDFIVEQPQGITEDPNRDLSVGEQWAGMFVGSYQQAVRSAAEPARAWLNTDPPLYRLAVGARLLIPGPEIGGVYRTLARYLTGINLENVTTPDFVFRINRERVSKTNPSVPINRLAAWSIGQGQMVTVPIGSGQPSSSSVQFALHLELDINTRTAQDKNLNSDVSIELLEELITLGAQIAAGGDIP